VPFDPEPSAGSADHLVLGFRVLVVSTGTSPAAERARAC
jgi:hypothetical protein